jgi:hypothetical protein
MFNWDIISERVITLFIAVTSIFTFQPTNPAVLPAEHRSAGPTVIKQLVKDADRKVFPDSERAEEIKIIVMPPVKEAAGNLPKDEQDSFEIGITPKENVVTPLPSRADLDTLSDLQKQLESLTQELNRKLAENSPEPNLFTVADINSRIKSSLVNILCTTRSGNTVRSITGSGVVIDSRGVILTNAHVAQVFLIKDYPVANSTNCTIRGGSPAKELYKADLLYIPPSWVEEHKATLSQSNPVGTGENDFAFLLIKDPVSGALPSQFPYLPMLIADAELNVGDNVVVAGYAAGFLNALSIQNELYLVTAISKIFELFTFRTQSLDLISVGGSIVAQRGSSGGAVVNENTELVAVIVTSTEAPNTSERDLRAITLSHINRSLQNERGSSLGALLSGDLLLKSNLFLENEAPRLRQLIINSN